MSAFWGSVSSLFIGMADLSAAKVGRRISVVTLTGTAMLGGVAAALAGLMIVDSELRADDVLLGAGAGVAMAVALAFYLRAMQVVSIAISSPVTAVQIALWPFAYDIVVDGARPAGLAWAGVAVGIGSLFLTTWSPESSVPVAGGLRLALVAGALYGIGWILLGTTDEASGLWPAVSHRGTGVVVFLVIATTRGVPAFPRAGGWGLPLLAGGLGTGGLIAYLIGTQRGSLGVVAVTGAMFPAVSVVLLHRFVGHPLRWWQSVGVGGAIAGVSLIALG